MYEVTLKLVRVGEKQVKAYLPSPVMRFCSDNRFIQREESYYCLMRDEEGHLPDKLMYDRIRATLKYAGTLGATLAAPVRCEFLGHQRYELVIYFEFHSSSAAEDFLITANESVFGAIKL